MFEPDYRNIVDAAYNREAVRIPLYEHIVSFAKIGEILNKDIESLYLGDDLGYKSMTLLSTEDIHTHIMPQYKKIVDLVHSYQKPFLLHSCGNIKDVMEDLITYVGINAKHSNEDQIAPFPYWVHTYGDRIGNFGGFDLGVVCNASKPELKEYITDIIRQCEGYGGVAFGTGNSIPDYVPVEGYFNMLEIVREYRGDFR